MARNSCPRLIVILSQLATFLVVAFFLLKTHGATGEECQKFLQSEPVRIQCGPTCLTHTLVSLVESHLQRRMSIEYTLLAQLIRHVRIFTPSSVEEARQLGGEFPEFESKLLTGSQTIDSALLTLAQSGLATHTDFLSDENKRWFRKNLGNDLSERGILNFRKQYVSSLKATLQKCASLGPHCRGAIEEISERYVQLLAWFNTKEKKGRSLWNDEGSHLEFELFSADALMVKETKDFAAHISELKKTRPIVFNLTSHLNSKEEIELQLDKNLADGFPVAIIMQTSEGGLHTEIVTQRLEDRSVVTRNTALIRRWWFWDSPAPILIRPQKSFSKSLIGIITVKDSRSVK